MTRTLLQEVVLPSNGNLITESVPTGEKGAKNMFMRGVFLQGGIVNQNNRIYPVNEISRAVDMLNDAMRKGQDILGEADHPDDFNISIQNVSHKITEMSMSGDNGIGKLQILPTPKGNICLSLLESGVKLGVSSRGQGDIDAYGNISNFEIVTIDIVANPSAPDAYPMAFMEQLERAMGRRHFGEMRGLSKDACIDDRAKKYLTAKILKFIGDL